ncbi:sigma-70 family RNA polymerase sigma factor [Actinomadura madurae]|uniref:sigma-70 family RNA polymerase sigma factor n=1 Tax=Actinomadura madurae TaxID=1993 RepID=UPI0020267F77|nr:sigma-70 family RNA polymerase sigma factor [Actinomadura madurae]URM98922.1 sigma-70 family RNA polymerase sigma factor [Actinomadura madurae]URN09613.1 sigma-70 family RNA polymerase sigma factor [Actinomadura madurae]
MDLARVSEDERNSGDDRPAPVGFRARNDELFDRRRRLQEQVAELSARVDSGASGEVDSLAELALWRAQRELEDVTAEIVTANYGLVRRYVSMFTSRSSAHGEDFESAGKVGLMWAIASYDPAKGPFAGWAFKPIQREILRAVRDADHPNLNPCDFERRPAILAAERSYLEEFGQNAPPDHAEIARRAQVTEAQVRRVLTPPKLERLHNGVAGDGEEEGAWEEHLADPSTGPEEEALRRFDLRAVARHWLPSLDARERYVLTRRFGLDGQTEQSLRRIGQELGLSREGVRQIQHKALAKLNEPIVTGTRAVAPEADAPPSQAAADQDSG